MIKDVSAPEVEQLTEQKVSTANELEAMYLNEVGAAVDQPADENTPDEEALNQESKEGLVASAEDSNAQQD